VALVMAAMLAVSASAAFAARDCHCEGSTLVCTGGEASRGGGAGEHYTSDSTTHDVKCRTKWRPMPWPHTLASARTAREMNAMAGFI
jgi:hypothetical protein